MSHGHGLGVFAEGTRQQFGHPGPMHPGAAMIAIQEGVPIVPCGIDTFGWTPKNRRPCCVVWGDPIELDLPRNGKGYKEGTAIVEEQVHSLWRQAAQAIADGFPEALPDGAPTVAAGHRSRADRLSGAAEVAGRRLGGGPARPGLQRLTRPDETFTESSKPCPMLPACNGLEKGGR